jgi:hypothetical protein
LFVYTDSLLVSKGIKKICEDARDSDGAVAAIVIHQSDGGPASAARLHFETSRLASLADEMAEDERGPNR